MFITSCLFASDYILFLAGAAQHRATSVHTSCSANVWNTGRAGTDSDLNSQCTTGNISAFHIHLRPGAFPSYTMLLVRTPISEQLICCGSQVELPINDHDLLEIVGLLPLQWARGTSPSTITIASEGLNWLHSALFILTPTANMLVSELLFPQRTSAISLKELSHH